jgi:hypothetical protein
MRTPDAVGVYIREILSSSTTAGLSNTELANYVVNHFSQMTFDGKKLRQRIANTKFSMRREVNEAIGDNADTSSLGEASTNP